MDMETFQVGSYSVEYDSAETATAHSRIGTPGPEACGCWYCLNWSASRRKLVPAAVQAMLDRLGIPLAGETEVYEMTGDDGLHIYGGWYTFAGRVRGPEEGRDELAIEAWRLHYSDGMHYRVDEFDNGTASELSFVVYGVGDFIEPPTDEAGFARKVSRRGASFIRRWLDRGGWSI